MNTRCFQVIDNKKFKKKLVGSVRWNGSLVEDPLQIKQAVVSHFSNIFKEDYVSKAEPGGTFPRLFYPTWTHRHWRINFICRRSRRPLKTVTASRLQFFIFFLRLTLRRHKIS